MKTKLLAAFALLLGLSGCSVSLSGDNYIDQTPVFELTEFFDGEVKAWGIVQNRSGEVVQRFEVEILGRNEQGVLILDETFVYGLGDGPKTRTWTIKQTSPGVYSGKASDIESPATGIAYGNAFNFTYEMDLPVDDTTYRVAFDDWFFAMDDNTMMNRSYIKKFGLVMAEVTIFMQKKGSTVPHN